MSTIKVLNLKNFAHAEEAEYKFGKFNIIRGKNAQGKTTILSAIKYLFNGGNEAELLTPGSESGEVVLLLDDGSKARRRVAPDSSSEKFSMKDSEGRTVSKPASAIKEQFDSFSLDPLKFLKAKNDEQTKLLLASLPITITDEQLSSAIGRPTEATSEHPITQIARLHKSLFDERTDINRAVKQRTIHIEQLEKTVPAGYNPDNSTTGKTEELEQRKAQIESKRVERREAISLEAAKKLDECARERERRMKEVTDWYDAQKDAIKEERDAKLDEMMQKSSAVYDPIVEELKSIRINSENDTVWRSTVLTIKHEKSMLEADAKQQEKINQSMEGLEKLKGSLLADLPIKGVEIVDGVITVNGTSINQLSQSESLRLAVKIATLRMGDIKAVLVDNGECFDSDSFEKLVTVCEKAGVQLFVTLVTDEDDVTVDVADKPQDAVGKRRRALTAVPA